MLYAVMMRFDSLREITAGLFAETHRLSHPGITFKIGRSTLADANKRRPEAIFEAIYRDLYATYRHVLSPDSRSGKTPKWMKRLHIIDSTTITLFSNLLFKESDVIQRQGKHTLKDKDPSENEASLSFYHIPFRKDLCRTVTARKASVSGQENYHSAARCSLRMRIISIALFGMRVPGPKIAHTPAL